MASISDGDLGEDLIRLLDTGITEQIKTESDPSVCPIGSKAEIKLLYTGSRSYCDCCPTWRDDKPKNDDDDFELKQRLVKARDHYAILKRLNRHGHGQWNTHSIVINSKHIRDRLSEVFDDYPNVDLHAVEMVFQPPFVPFVHRWEKLIQIRDDETNQEARDHLTLLVDLLSTTTEESFKTLTNIHRTGFVAFEDLELLYTCGEIVLQAAAPGSWSAGILRDVDKKCEGLKRFYGFTVDVVDWNGEVFGIRRDYWTLGDYKGSRSLHCLEIMPLKVHPNPKDIQALLVARGRRFESLKGQHLQQYDRNAPASANIGSSPSLGSRNDASMSTSERVIVDARTFHSLQRSSFPPALRSLKQLDSHLRQQRDHHRWGRFPSSGSQISDSRPATKIYSTEALTSIISELAGSHSHSDPEKKGSDDAKHNGLSDEACLLSVPFVKGFKIESKTWAHFEISKLSDVNWNDRALENLVLGQGEKKVITALISSKQARGKRSFDDFIQGKGRGVIFLLGGPPGVGKTLTAESVAEHLRRPLYRLGASDLGSSTESVEARLSEALIRCAAWNALLLIDEADIFLECRTPDNLQRNELVSIFLRLLEYYSGVLFLTTNRMGTLDPAFESRIDIAFHYPNLDLEGRAAVFRNLLTMLPHNSVEPLSDDDVAELLSEPLNGRHIKSAVKTAHILAQAEGSRMSREHLKVVLEIRKKTRAFLDQK